MVSLKIVFNIFSSKEKKQPLSERVKSYTIPTNDCTIDNIDTSKSRVKKYFCKFCKRLYSKLVKHLEAIHADQEEVQKFSLLPKGIVFILTI